MDNEREIIDRGYSGRFSSNMGFKYDFEDEQAEEFASHAESLNSSLLLFKKEEPVAETVNYGHLDEEESLRIIESASGSASKAFKLFYYRKMVS